jgi:hypothetical protein
MFDENHPDHDEYWRARAIKENCAFFGEGCPNDCDPAYCSQFRFRSNHKFAWIDEALNR